MLGNVNFSKLRKKIKICKNKFKSNTLTIGLWLLLGLTGCESQGDFSSDDVYLHEVVDMFDVESDEEFIETENMVKSESLFEVENNKTQDVCDKYVKYYDEFNVNYNLEEYIISEQRVYELIENFDSDPACDYNSSKDMNKLFEKIKNNSFEYIEGKSDFESAFIENNYGTDEYDADLYNHQLCLEIFLEKILNVYIQSATNDVDEDIHKMQTLKIVYGDTNKDNNIILGYYDEINNAIVLSRKYISIISESKNLKFEYVLYKTLLHELNHVRQHKCDCRIDGENEWRRISYDDGLITTLIESSAESEIYNLNKQLSFVDFSVSDYTYKLERNYESLIFLLGLFNESVNVENYYNSIFDSNWNSLLSFCELDTNEEKYLFFKLIYIIDALNSRNSLPFDYYSLEELTKGVTRSQLQTELGYGYKTEIFRLCLKRLVEYTCENPEFDFIDNLMIFNFIKNEIVDGAYIFDQSNKRIYDEVFVNEVLNLENKYISFLTEYYNVTCEEIRELEKDYIYWYGVYTASLVTSNTCSNDNYYLKAQKLLERFPLLKPILYENGGYKSNYISFTINNNIKTYKKVD